MKKMIVDNYKAISAEELINTKDFKEVPGKYYGYIDKAGYITLKHYGSKRYKQVQEDNMPLFISVFEASGYKAAMEYIKKILEKALNLPVNL